MNLVAPNNRDKIDIIIVGKVYGGSAATLAEQGYNVKGVLLQDSPRRAHLLQHKVV